LTFFCFERNDILKEDIKQADDIKKAEEILLKHEVIVSFEGNVVKNPGSDIDLEENHYEVSLLFFVVVVVVVDQLTFFSSSYENRSSSLFQPSTSMTAILRVSRHFFHH